MINEEVLDLDKKGAEAIIQQSTLLKYTFNPLKPTWTKSTIGVDMLRDTDTITENEYDYVTFNPST